MSRTEHAVQVRVRAAEYGAGAIVSHPLDSLVPPLRYACQRNFAQLGTVKDLRGLLERAVQAARLGGVAAEHVAGLAAELEQVDAPGAEHPKAGLSRGGGALPRARGERP